MSFTGSIIIVNFNSGRCLTRCLDSIAELEEDAEVLVVDNASTDGSEKAAERGGRFALQRNAENVGFGRAVNQGLARALRANSCCCSTPTASCGPARLIGWCLICVCIPALP